MQLAAPEVFAQPFFGERFDLSELRSFRPDATIDHKTDVTIGGTHIELIPIQGGETHDALFIHLPAQKLLFVGDFIMPYLGAPFVPEGDMQGLLDAIDVVVALKPQVLLHGQARSRNPPLPSRERDRYRPKYLQKCKGCRPSPRGARARP